MREQLRDQRNHIQEQRAQLAMDYQHISDNIRGNKEYELHVYDEMQTVMRNYEQMELCAENTKH